MDQQNKELIEAQVLSDKDDLTKIQGSPIATELFDMEVPKGFHTLKIRKYKGTNPKEHIQQYHDSLGLYSNLNHILCPRLQGQIAHFVKQPATLEDMITKVNEYVDLERMMSKRHKSTKSVLTTKGSTRERNSEPREHQGDQKRSKGNPDRPQKGNLIPKPVLPMMNVQISAIFLILSKDKLCRLSQPLEPIEGKPYCMHHEREKSAAGVLCHLKKRQPTFATSIKLAKDVVGIVAILGKVGGENLRRLCLEYIGLDTTMEIMCKTLKGAKALETMTKKDESIRVLVFTCLGLLSGGTWMADIPYVGDFVANDPQRRLALLKPRLPTGDCPHGLLGFVVNINDLESINPPCLIINSHGLRETLFYILFSCVKILIEMGEAEEKEQEATSLLRRGGSKRRRIDKRKIREHKLGENSLNWDYFGDNPRFKGISFRRRF
ncbi:hypothetical protein GIB67_032036 [Kingdonia uniflora]|uniref:Uncharacterized protein n=1 Tax=Kingdonia uniflora TaxID=39325 RepID=A0A7J7MWH5_9MAGN|nr:hypothetical protein GIB67_032036 [Kingdonia uniflora]